MPTSTISAAAMAELDTALCQEQDDVHWDWYCSRSLVVRRLFTNVVPSVLLIAFEGLIMPMTLYYLVLVRDCTGCIQTELLSILIIQSRRSEVSFTAFELKMLDIYFYWSVFNVFLGGLLGGTVIAQLNLLLNNPSTKEWERGKSSIRASDALWELIGLSMASQAFFFTNYIIIRALVIVPLKLIYPHYNVVPGACFACGLLSTLKAE